MTVFGQILQGLAGEALQRDIGQALFVTSQRVAVESQISITTGAVSGANHVSSAPGEPPNNDTGGLVSSHETELVAWNHARVTVNAPYAVALENGTSKMEARPFLGPAARRQRRPMNELLKRAIRQAVARAARAAQ